MLSEFQLIVFLFLSQYCQSAADGDRDWQPLGNAEWAEMHIFKDSNGGGVGSATYRMVAWLPDTTEVDNSSPN
jgi:hypothetical protein